MSTFEEKLLEIAYSGDKKRKDELFSLFDELSEMRKIVCEFSTGSYNYGTYTMDGLKFNLVRRDRLIAVSTKVGEFRVLTHWNQGYDTAYCIYLFGSSRVWWQRSD